jgi:hypothetical protein
MQLGISSLYFFGKFGGIRLSKAGPYDQGYKKEQ